MQAASTLYGPHTLSAYIQEFKKLAQAMAKGDSLKEGPQPPDLSSVQLRFMLDPLFGNSLPPRMHFGDMKQDITLPKNGYFKRGEKPSATFVSANPRYDLLTEGTFAVVEMLEGGQWNSVYDDDDFNLYFKYKLDDTSFSGLANIEWEIPQKARPGIYRLRHFGSSRQTKDSPTLYFTGASIAFGVEE